jgi:hypothetical protein
VLDDRLDRREAGAAGKQQDRPLTVFAQENVPSGPSKRRMSFSFMRVNTYSLKLPP